MAATLNSSRKVDHSKDLLYYMTLWPYFWAVGAEDQVIFFPLNHKAFSLVDQITPDKDRTFCISVEGDLQIFKLKIVFIFFIISQRQVVSVC